METSTLKSLRNVSESKTSTIKQKESNTESTETNETNSKSSRNHHHHHHHSHHSLPNKTLSPSLLLSTTSSSFKLPNSTSTSPSSCSSSSSSSSSSSILQRNQGLTTNGACETDSLTHSSFGSSYPNGQYFPSNNPYQSVIFNNINSESNHHNTHNQTTNEFAHSTQHGHLTNQQQQGSSPSPYATLPNQAINETSHSNTYQNLFSNFNNSNNPQTVSFEGKYAPLIYPNSAYSHSSSSSTVSSASSNSQSDAYASQADASTSAAAAIAAAAVVASHQQANSGAFLRYMRPNIAKPENVCSWIDPETKQMCNRVFYRMDEIGNLGLF